MTNASSLEEIQILVGNDAIITTLESQEKHTVLNEAAEMRKGMVITLTSDPNFKTNVNINDKITYKFEFENNSKYEYIYPTINIEIPEGTEFINVYSDSQIIANNFSNEDKCVTCMFEELSSYSKICLNLEVAVTGTEQKIKAPYMI